MINILPSLVFYNYVILGGQILNILETVFPKLIFHQEPKIQLPDVLLRLFYINLTYVVNHCI